VTLLTGPDRGHSGAGGIRRNLRAARPHGGRQIRRLGNISVRTMRLRTKTLTVRAGAQFLVTSPQTRYAANIVLSGLCLDRISGTFVMAGRLRQWTGL
jgi:hypothetical protein